VRRVFLPKAVASQVFPQALSVLRTAGMSLRRCFLIHV